MKLRILFIALLVSSFSWGQASIATIGTPVTENFDALTTVVSPTTTAWTNGTTANGWYAKTSAGTGISIITYMGNTGSATTGALYSYGVAGTNAVTDRALGVGNSNTFTGASGTGRGYYGWRLKNNTGAAISSITIVWTGEQWRKSGVLTAQTLLLSYQTSTSAITDLTAGSWTSTSSSFSTPINTATAAALDGNAAANRTAGITITISVAMAAGDEIMLRWEDLNDTGSDNFMAIDDVSVTCYGLTTAIATGPWSNTTTWDTGVVPPANGNVLIPSPFTVHLTGNITRNAGTTTTVAVGGTLATANSGVANTNTYTNNGITTINGTFRVEENGSAAGTNFAYGAAGTLNFTNTLANTPAGKIIVNTDVFWPTINGPFNVNVIGDITLSAGAPRTVNGTFSTGTFATSGVTNSGGASALTINGTLRINAGGRFANTTSAPIYGPSSTLVYNTGGVFLRSNEWIFNGIGTIGTTQGYPNNVQISTLGTNFKYNTVAGTQRAMAGSLTIDTGTTFDMSVSLTAPTLDLTIGGAVTNNGTFIFSRANAVAGASSVVVGGNFTNSGTVTLSNIPSSGGNLRLAGNFSNSGTFNAADRSIFFTRTGAAQVQTVASTTALTFPYVHITGTDTTVQLLNNLTISAPSATVNGGVAVTFAAAADAIDLNGRTLTIGTAAVANTIAGSGSFRGSTTSNLSLLGSGNIGTLRFASNLNLGTFTMNRTASAVGCVMGSALTVNTALNLTAGLIDLGANTMTLISGVNPTGSVNSYVIADVSAGGILNKEITATGTNYVFPVGSGGTEFAPATVNFSAGSFATATLGMAVENPVLGHPNWSFAASYIKRYWSLTSSGITTPTYDFSATYPAADVVGIIGADYKSNQWDGSDWSNGGIAITSGTISKTGCTLNTGTNHISAAIRDQEIDIRGGGNIIANGANTTSGLNGTAFGTQTIGASTPNTFTIINRGGLNLTIGAITIGGANPGDFSVTTLPSSPVSAESSTTFVITFTPSYAGTRTATVSIVNNDSNENPYTFVINGFGECSIAASNIIIPTSGPVGTEVTITAVTNNLFSATATMNGIAATASNYSPAMATATVIKIIIPASAVSGPLVTTNNLGCQASNTFTVIDNASSSCEGGSVASDLFISELTDSNSGALSYIEIYNGTGVTKNLSGYSLRTANNGGGYSFTMVLSNVNLANGNTYVVAFGNDSSCSAVPGGNGSYAAQSSGSGSVNFSTGGHDHIGLFNGVTLIDSWGFFGSNNWAPGSISTEGATFRRKNTATLPSTTFNNSDWNISDWLGSGIGGCANNDYSDIGSYNFRAGIPPTVTTLSYTPTCKSTTLTVTGSQGFAGGFGLVYKWYAVQNGTNTWNLISDGGIYSGATTGSLYISDIASVIDYQFYCQVWENAATCFIASNAVKITSSQSTTWQVGNTWSNSAPTINTAVIIDNDYDTANGFSPSFDACSLTINNSKTVTIRANNFVNIQNDLTVTGNLTVESSGSLVMIDDNGVVTNTGTTQIKRTATGIRGYDYVYWSSPVTGQSVDNLYSSPTPGFKYKWNPLATNINSPLSSGRWEASSGSMDVGTGYIVRGSSNFNMAATNIPAVFTGPVNNGVIPVNIGRGSNTTPSTVGSGNGVTFTNFDDNWNLVGNPYPSAIRTLDFLNANTNIQGFIYLWTHNTAPISSINPFYSSFLYNYTSNDYIAYNGTATTTGPIGPPTFNGNIAGGQGFFVLMNDGATGSGTINFRNSMRNNTYANNQFYRNSQTGEEDKHRIWLDLLDSNTIPVRTVIGYVPEATNGLDRLYDARKNTANEMHIYSIVENETQIIQGRSLPFDTNDTVQIGVRIMQEGEYKIAIGAVDGLFSEPTQNIYIEDKLLGIIHDLRQSPYSFTTLSGIFNDRFVLRYERNSLGNPDFETDNTVIVSSNLGQIAIHSSSESIEEVMVFDILRRQLFVSQSIGQKDFSTSKIAVRQQTLIVKIKLENGTIVTRKIVL